MVVTALASTELQWLSDGGEVKVNKQVFVAFFYW